MNVHYYLIVDVGTQWFSSIVGVQETKETLCKEREGNQIVEEHDIHGLRGGFLDNIYQRELAFTYRALYPKNDCYYGWSLSPQEFGRIKRLVELRPAVTEFNRLAAYV